MAARADPGWQLPRQIRLDTDPPLAMLAPALQSMPESNGIIRADGGQLS
jgi:hypothetical protein